jgi:zinc protease
MTWVAVGDIEHKELSLLIDQKLKGLHSSSAKKGYELSIGELDQAEYQESVESKQTTIVLGLRAPRMGSPDYFAFRVMNTMLSGMGGKLFGELREKKSLAYSVHASHDAALRAGIYQIYIGCSPEKVQEAKKGLLKVLKDFTEEKIDPLDLERAKTYMAGLNKMGLQANRSQVYSYGRYEMSGLGCKTVDKIPAIVKAVSADEVRAMAKKYLISDKNTWVLVGPHKKGK